MHFKPRWLAYIFASITGLIAVKNIFAWNGDIAALIALLSVALGAGLRDLFEKPEAP